LKFLDIFSTTHYKKCRVHVQINTSFYLEEINIGYFDSLKEIPAYLYDLPKLKKVTIGLDIRKDELNQDEYKAIYDKFKERGISFEVE